MGEHVHDCTGPDMICPCGYKFTVPRFSMSFDVSDGAEVLISDHFDCDRIGVVISTLHDAIRKLEARDNGR